MHASIPHKFQQTISHARLLALLRYEPQTGEFFWLVRRQAHGGPVFPGDKVRGATNIHGYQVIGLDGKRYQASRLAWFYVHGVWPNGEVDHINRNIRDNCIANLRVAERRFLQRANQKVRKDSKSGLKGVNLSPHNGRWRARCRQKTLGHFDTAEEAHSAYLKAARAAFGDYARSK